MRPALLAALVSCCSASVAAAAEDPPPRWTIGGMVIQRDAPYRDFDEGLWAVPMLRFEGERAYVRGLRGGVRLVQQDGFEFGPVLQLRFDGYDADESDFLEGMEDRDFSIDAGLAAGYRVEKVGQFEASWVTDVLDRSDGSEFELGYTALFRAGGFTFVPNLSVKFQDEDVVDYYYGVRPDEATAARPAYRGDSAVVPELSVTAMRELSPQWTLYARIGHAWLPSEITDSPIVDDDNRTVLGIGVGWSPRSKN